MNTIESIHESLVNGQRKQAVEFIKEYGLYDFWAEYAEYLSAFYHPEDQLRYFTDMTIGFLE